MDVLFESGLFSELEGVMGCDPVLYEDIQKQHDSYYSSSPVDMHQNGAEDVLLEAANSQPVYLDSGNGELDSLLAENNQLLEQLMAANGLELPTDSPADLTDIDEVSEKVNYLHDNMVDSDVTEDLLAELDSFVNSDEYPVVSSPASSISTLPSEPSSPIDLLPFFESKYELEQPSCELTDLLQSLLEEKDNTPVVLSAHAAFAEETDTNLVTLDQSYESYSSPSASDELWNDTFSAHSFNSSDEPEVIGKLKSKKKSKSTPYSKLPATRKERKKKQNKEAAIRYREKKRKEADEAHGEEAGLSKRNGELKTEVLNLEREIMCMKELLSDVFNIHSL